MLRMRDPWISLRARDRDRWREAGSMVRRLFGEESSEEWEHRKQQARAERRGKLTTLTHILGEFTEDAVIRLPLAALTGDLLAARRVIAAAAASTHAPSPELLEFAHLAIDILEDGHEVIDCQREADNRYVYAQPGNREWGRYLRAC